MASINQKIEVLSQKYKELRKCEIPVVQKLLITEIRALSTELIKALKSEQTAEGMRRKRQIEDILKKCTQIEKEIQGKMQIGDGGRKVPSQGVNVGKVNIGKIPMVRDKVDEQLSRSVVKTMLMYEVKSSQMKISPAELDEIAKRMEQNLQVMKQIEEMIHEQGGNLDKIEEHISQAYENVKIGVDNLEEAKQQQHINRILKIRMGLAGFFGLIGMKLFGWVGAIGGLFAGLTMIGKGK